MTFEHLLYSRGWRYGMSRTDIDPLHMKVWGGRWTIRIKQIQ